MNSILRFLTAGSVDDGKSTLIGRLLFDSKSVYEDQLEAIERSSERRGDGYTNLALLTDGLKAEREQGITIDVAYKYFSTPKRKFIIADTPGHIQYTRNMVTGASTASLAIILIDARKGVIEQTKRHSFLLSLLGIEHLVVCINKIDLVEFSESVYNSICEDYKNFSKSLKMKSTSFFPISALDGDNVVDVSNKMKWYSGPSLLSFLEEVEIHEKEMHKGVRFPVQWVIRPMSEEHHDYRGYAGELKGGIVSVGDIIQVLPSGQKSTVFAIDCFAESLTNATEGKAITIRLTDEIDISRGDILCSIENQPEVENEFSTYLCWMDTKTVKVGTKFLLRQTTVMMKAVISEIEYKINTSTLEKIYGETELSLNDIARVKIKTAKPLVFDDYSVNRSMGSFILVDEGTNNTSAAGMIYKKEIL
ncbi:MAG: GTP-binding protein [Leptospiraceae bacterium]|nr:GTP-binding protein [Leptospiraceae bacterium]